MCCHIGKRYAINRFSKEYLFVCILVIYKQNYEKGSSNLFFFHIHRFHTRLLSNTIDSLSSSNTIDSLSSF